MQQPFSKVLIANRGEIACRVMRTAARLGVRTVAIFSEPDADALHVRTADEAICVGPAASSQSYLNVEAILAAVRSTGAQAVHPGYGFLSENARFVEMLEAAGVAFVGPSAAAIAAMGDKIESKLLAKKAGVSTIPGCEDVIRDEDHAAAIAKDVGFPVMLKATAGGGGKGMRIAWNADEARESFRLCSAEAASSFGDGRIFIERFIEQPRHIEFQVLGDKHGHVVYLPERECSIQRRNQKVIEEAPSTFLDPGTRRAMGEQAVALAQAVGYSSAGTVEFLVDARRNFYFLEMNTRLQVEHPITELVTGLDLVEVMLRVAAGEKLQLTQERAARWHGWAVESRVYAEDPRRGFLPSSGRLRHYEEPRAGGGGGGSGGEVAAGEIVRVDSGVEEGSKIGIFYDPLIAKLSTWGPDRNAAIASMERALDSYVIGGLTHNAPFLRSVVSHPEFVAGNTSTKFLAQQYPDGWSGDHLTAAQQEELAAIAVKLHVAARERARGLATFGARESEGPETLIATIGGSDFAASFSAADADTTALEVEVGGRRLLVREAAPVAPGRGVVSLTLDGRPATCQVLGRLPRGYKLQYAGAEKDVLVQTALQARLAKHMRPPPARDYSKVLRSPMPGALISLAVKQGQEVLPGAELAVVEAMKMRNVLRATQAAVVKAVCAAEGATLSVDQVIMEFE